MKKWNKALRSEKGFTLIELVVVVIIIGILAAVALPQFFKQTDKAKVGRVTSELRSIQDIIDQVYSQNNAYPQDDTALDNELTENGMEWPKADPWGRIYIYLTDTGSSYYEVYSLGKDNAAGTADDVYAQNSIYPTEGARVTH